MLDLFVYLMFGLLLLSLMGAFVYACDKV